MISKYCFGVYVDDLHLLLNLQLEQNVPKKEILKGTYIREHSSTPSTSSRASRSLTPFLSSSEPLPTTCAISDEPGTSSCREETRKTSEVMDTVLLARIEMLESENSKLKKESTKKKYSLIEDILDDDKLVSFYTGFVSYMYFLLFLSFWVQLSIILIIGDQKKKFVSEVAVVN